MHNSSSPEEQPKPHSNTLLVKLVNSKSFGRLANVPPIAGLLRWAARRISRGQFGKAVVASPGTKRGGTGLQSTLERIVIDVVEELNYVGAMLATYEQGDTLPVRAFYIQPGIASSEQIATWEKSVSRFIDPKYLKYPEYPLSISRFDSPNVSQVFVYEEEYAENLSVKAAQSQTIVTSNDLYDLFRPIATPATKNIIKGIQQELNIQQVVAVPFFIGEEELVGNLFAAKDSIISEKDQSILAAYATQASAAIEGERRRLQIDIAQRLVFQLQENILNEMEILQQIAKGVVEGLQYIGAMVATYEQDGALPIRAFYIHPEIAALDQVREWEQKVSPLVDPEFLPNPDLPISISNPDSPNIGRVFVQEEKYQDNLSVKAAQKMGPSFGDSLYELFTPIAPPSSKPIIDGIQQELGVKKVVAVPFFLGDQLIGNLFAASRSRSFRKSEIELLEAFGQQAAAGIRNARLYRRSEHRREASEKFAKMAFSASANVHALRNHLGAVNTHLQLLNLFRADPEKLSERLDSNQNIIKRLKEAASILDKLHEPWQQQPDVEVDVNAALRRALTKVNDKLNLEEHIQLDISYEENLPPVTTSYDMLVEAFKILIKNGMEAILEKHEPTEGNPEDVRLGVLHVESRCGENSTIEVIIQDDGVGIASENLPKIFELNWSTKQEGMGFGLFWLRDYVEGFGGVVLAESKLHEGATFLVRLPAKHLHNQSVKTNDA